MIFLFQFDIKGNGLDFSLNEGIGKEFANGKYFDLEFKMKPLINEIGNLLMPYRSLSVSPTILTYDILDTDEEEVMLSKGLGIHIPLFIKNEIFNKARQLAAILIEVMDRHSKLEEEENQKYSQSEESQPGKPKYINITPAHVNIALEIDRKYTGLLQKGFDNAFILGEMSDLMPKFKKLMDELGQNGLDQLSLQFVGFYRFGKLLELVAAQIASGEIKVPN